MARLTSKQRNWVLILVCVLVIAGVRVTYVPERPITGYFDTQHPRVIAHQGGNLLMPGNTFLALDHALDLGVDVLEIDVQQSQDGVLYVIHDATVDRTTNSTGAVSEMESDALDRLDAAYHWPFDGTSPHRGHGVVIPRLKSVIDRYSVPMVVELKPSEPRAAERLCAAINDADAADRVVVASFHDSALSAFRSACPAVATSASAKEVARLYWLDRFGLARFFDAPASVLQLGHEQREADVDADGAAGAGAIDRIDPDLVDQMQRAGVQTEYWTINDPQRMREAIRAEADGIMTDRPDLLLEELGRR